MSDSTLLFLIGLVVGVALTTAYSVFLMMQQDRRHRDEKALLRRQLDPALHEAPSPPSPEHFDDPNNGFNTEWVKHTDYHWTCLLCGSKLQYWPTRNKWHWRGQVFEGDDCGDTVEQFIQRRVREFYE